MSLHTNKKIETRARYSLAVKSGGMRIVQKYFCGGDDKEEREKDNQKWESTSPPKPSVYISGVTSRSDKDFCSAIAHVVHFHPKPHLSMEKHPHRTTQHIQQSHK
uniref:Uncharacterized protein n=1 Tax=Sarcophilus harrisii TaxID=9305 RepID=A0A7N4V5J9_SARHA